MRIGPNADKPLTAACQKRKHLYDANEVCKRCGWQRTGVVGRPPRKVAGPEGSARLAATLGVPAPAASSTPTIFSSAPAPVAPDAVVPPQPNGTPAGAPPAPEKAAAALAQTATAAAAEKKPGDREEPSKSTLKLCRKISRKLTRLFDAGTDALIESFEGKDYTREAGEADEEDLEDFEENLAVVLARRLPDVEMGPGAATILAGALIIGDKCLGSKKVPKPKNQAITAKETAPEGAPTGKGDDRTDAPAAATTASLILLPPSTS